MDEVRAQSRDLDLNESLARVTNDTATVKAIGEPLIPILQGDCRVLGRARAWADDGVRSAPAVVIAGDRNRGYAR